METLVYLPSNYINDNYIYYLDNDHYIVNNDNQCTNIYFNNNYLASSTYSCNDIHLPPLQSGVFTDNWHYRLDANNIYIVSCIYIVFICLIYLILFKVFRKGFNL